jgi:hypothetical protein
VPPSILASVELEQICQSAGININAVAILRLLSATVIAKKVQIPLNKGESRKIHRTFLELIRLISRQSIECLSRLFLRKGRLVYYGLIIFYVVFQALHIFNIWTELIGGNFGEYNLLIITFSSSFRYNINLRK